MDGELTEDCTRKDPMQIETRLSDQLSRYLDLATKEAKLTAANMANVDTPGYRAVGMDFEAQVREIDGLIARADGNDVSIDRESLNLAQAQLKFKTGVVLLRGEYQRVMDAIHADGK
jgi:flagellar basal-body rod protein FlgB